MWLFCIDCGFAGFVVSLFVAVWRGFKADGSRRRALLGWIVCATLFFGLWLAGISHYPVPYPN